jgi:hypothetical protein
MLNCLQRGMDWAFKQSGLRFVFNGLKNKQKRGKISTTRPQANSRDWWMYILRPSGIKLSVFRL